MARFKNYNWNLNSTTDGRADSWQTAQMAVLMDIRDELQTLRQIFQCSNFLDIPRKIDRIVKNTTKKPKLKLVKTRKAA